MTFSIQNSDQKFVERLPWFEGKLKIYTFIQRIFTPGMLVKGFLCKFFIYMDFLI